MGVPAGHELDYLVPLSSRHQALSPQCAPLLAGNRGGLAERSLPGRSGSQIEMLRAT